MEEHFCFSDCCLESKGQSTRLPRVRNLVFKFRRPEQEGWSSVGPVGCCTSHTSLVWSRAMHYLPRIYIKHNGANGARNVCGWAVCAYLVHSVWAFLRMPLPPEVFSLLCQRMLTQHRRGQRPSNSSLNPSKPWLPITTRERQGGRDCQIKNDVVSLHVCLFTSLALSEGSVCWGLEAKPGFVVLLNKHRLD